MFGNTSRSYFLAAAAMAVTLVGAQADAGIIAVNDGFFGGSAPGATVSSSIAVGAGADMLIVMTSNEVSGTGPMTVTYGDIPMLQAVGNEASSAIWYLDLATPGITGSTVSVDLNNFATRNGFAAGWVSIDGNLGAGQSIVLHSVGTSTPGFNTVDLTTTVETFNVVNFNGNNTGGDITVGSPILPTEVIYTDNNIGSARGAAAYDEGVLAGTTTYSWTISTEATPPPANSDFRRIDAAAFVVIPEPGALVLLASGLLGMIWLRPRK